MVMTCTWLTSALAVVEDQHLLKHPFYQLWTRGELPLDALQIYARQYFQQVLAFPRYLSAVHANCPDLATRQEILGNLAAEELGPNNHPELWLRFAEGLGVTRAEILTSTANPHTQAAIATQLELSRNLPYGAGLAVVWAYETQVPAVAQQKISGLQQHYGINDGRTLEFFRVHGEADIHHSRAEETIIDQWATTPQRQAQVLQAVTETTQALNQILDGVMVQSGL
ncbi:CADD family putative folate metabolism protein [Candidatus Cyanaurora vandensis]|uniref:CADD family putative folate metabolism protein n=1 Tax=Candidatus Cyanaurora vandensis TaxID=2714958 RepID=UPI00257EAC55|nr:CADD family putative folate metabolism protein [Candidatus Cyanaurora vandensis]